MKQMKSISDSEVAIEEMKGTITKLSEEIAALEAGIKALDKAILEATAQRKEENAEYKDLIMNSTSKHYQACLQCMVTRCMHLKELKTLKHFL